MLFLLKGEDLMKKSIVFLKELNFLVLCTLMLNFAISFCRFMTMPFLIIYFSNNTNLEYQQIGIIIGLSSLSSLLFALLAGRWTDKVGAKIALPVSLIIPAVSFIGYLTTSNFYLLSIFSAVSGFSWAIYNSSNMTILAKFSNEKKEEVFGLNYWLFNLGAVLGPILGANLGAGDSQFVIYIFVITLILSSLALYFTFSRKKIEIDQSSNIDSQSFINTLGSLFSKKSIVYMLIAYFSLFYVQSQLETNVGLYLKDTFGEMGIKTFAYSLSLSAFVVLFFQPLFILLLKKRKDISVFLLGTLLTIIGTTSYLFFDTPLLLLIPILLISLGEVVYTPKLQALVANLAEDGSEATYFSLLNMSGNLAFFIGPWSGALLIQQNSSLLFGAMTLVGIMGGGSMILSYLAYKKKNTYSSNPNNFETMYENKVN